VATVELAVVTPLLLTMVMGIIEFGWAFMVHETMTNATREACRTAILQGVTTAEIQQRFATAMASTGLDATPVITYSDTDSPPDSVNDTVTVTVTVPYSDVTITGLTSFLGISRQSMSASCSMRLEGVM
jgi:Flp pilus assembly protein TadG